MFTLDLSYGLSYGGSLLGTVPNTHVLPGLSTQPVGSTNEPQACVSSRRCSASGSSPRLPFMCVQISTRPGLRGDLPLPGTLPCKF